MMMMIMYKVENGVGVLQITMLLPFKYVNDPNLLKTMKSIFMLDLWVNFNTCTKRLDLVNALYMYLEDYSLALFFSFVLATVYLCIYCHTIIGIYLFIYLFIYWAWLSLWFQCKLAFGIKTNIWMNFLCGVHLVSFDIHFFMWYIFHSPINYFTDWYLQRKSHAESWPQKGTVWQRYFIFCFVTIFSVRVRLW